MANRLAGSSSPYLLQHAGNPVDWWPWTEEAFDEARRRDVPVFLSIGYSTCHWCHVMERESFEDADVAEILNRDFVCVKVDREERPDIDHQYMAVCQAIGRHCGWPLTLWLTPRRLPFYAATYLPKTARFGRPGLIEIAGRVGRLWRSEREKVEISAQQVAELVHRTEHVPPPENPGVDVLDRAFDQLASRYDPIHGGFGAAPKFPMAHTIVFLLRYGAANGRPEATRMAIDTLRVMAGSAIHDQVGGGFHRYATDAEWRVPHFEKMLYDQAWALLAYTEGWEASRDESLRETALRIARYIGRDLTSAEGGLYAGEDADSEGREGLFYLWTAGELEAVLGPEDAAFAASWFGVEPGGNYRDEATGESNGLNVLHPRRAGDRVAGGGGALDAAGVRRLDRIRDTLLGSRTRRVRPSRDEKILADWNGLAIGALARAGARLREPALVADAERAARFVFDRLWDVPGGPYHVCFRGKPSVPAFLDDTAFLAWGCLELALASGRSEWIGRSTDLCKRMVERYGSGTGGLWHTESGNPAALVRQQHFHDGAMPSSNALALDTLARLARLTGRSDLDESASRLASAAGRLMNASPGSYAGLLIGWMQASPATVEVVLVGVPGDPGFDALASVLSESYLPGAMVWRLDPAAPTAHREGPHFGIDRPLPPGWQSAAYVCRGRACGLPVRTADELKRRLGLDVGPPA